MPPASPTTSLRVAMARTPATMVWTSGINRCGLDISDETLGGPAVAGVNVDASAGLCVMRQMEATPEVTTRAPGKISLKNVRRLISIICSTLLQNASTYWDRSSVRDLVAFKRKMASWTAKLKILDELMSRTKRSHCNNVWQKETRSSRPRLQGKSASYALIAATGTPVPK